MNDNQEIKIGTTDDDSNELKPSCRVEFDNVPQQVESLGGAIEWDGDGLPPVGIICEAFDYEKDDWVKVKTLDAVSFSGKMAVAVTGHDGGFSKVFWAVEFRKPETPQQREERERIEAAYELYTSAKRSINYSFLSFDHFKSCSQGALTFWLTVVDKTKYRKESK